MPQPPTRRAFLRTATLATTLAPSLATWLAAPVRAAANNPVRLGFIGTGNRGRAHLRQALNTPNVQILAICDVNPDAIQQTLTLFDELGKPRPAVYSDDETAFRQLLQRIDIDGVVIASSGHRQTPMAIAAMRASKYVGLAVATTADQQESWALVEAFEQTGTPCMFLESTCYEPDALRILSSIRQGDFGKMTYARSGYQQVTRTNTPYPTHGLGPVAQWLGINRGNRFVSLSGTITKSRALQPSPIEQAVTDSLNRQYTLGDVITTTLVCSNGATVDLLHDTGLLRPYGQGFRAQGTKQNWQTIPGGVQTVASEPGILMMHAFTKSIRNQAAPPIDVYDAALWGSINYLTQQSLAAGGKPITVPYFACERRIQMA